MECYFGSQELPNGNKLDKSALVFFSIPQLGIKFKAPFDAVDDNHSAFASLLALLEFIDSNQNFMAKQAYQIYGNNLSVINLVNEVDESPLLFIPLIEKAMAYKKKYRFSLQWIPTRENSAYDSLLD